MEKMEEFLNKYHCRRWLLPVLVILFVLQMFTLPLMVNYTYADRAIAPKLILNYRANDLRWDKASPNVNKDGVAVLGLFDAQPTAPDGDKLIFPGDQGHSSVRLNNREAGELTYTVVMYTIKSNPALPVTPKLSPPEKAEATTKYLLPTEVKKAQVIEAYTGTVGGKHSVDFDIFWNWDFYDSSYQDKIDTALGSRKEADNITVGLYIVVEDFNNYTLPKTADESHFGAYLTLMAVSGTLLILLLLEKRKETACESSNPSDDSSASA